MITSPNHSAQPIDRLEAWHTLPVRAQNLLSRTATAVWQRRNPAFDLHRPDREAPYLDLTVASVARNVVDRARLAAARRRNGIEGQPWITAESRRMLESMVLPSDRVVEFGAGGSTEWFAGLAAEVYSVDAFRHWHDVLAARLAAAGTKNVHLTLADAEELGLESAAHREAYVHAHPELGEGSVDVVFIDGEYRDDASLRGLGMLRSGGLFVVDNVNTYLPSTASRSPWKVARPVSPGWQAVADAVAGWRHHWTTNGVWDTALWIKP